MSGQLILVRHGQSEGNALRRFTSSPDTPLTAWGLAQARTAAAWIHAHARAARVYSSPFRRAHDTARVIAGHLGVEVAVEDDLREQHLGDLHGQPYDVARASDSFRASTPWEWRPPAGETLVEVQARAWPVHARIAQLHAGEDTVVVSHHGTIQAIWARVVGAWERAGRVPNASLLVVPHDERGFGTPELIELETPEPASD